MMVVKEPQESSEAVQTYPEIRWDLPGMRPLQVSLVLAVIATSLAGILSNPLFTLANNLVVRTPMLAASLEAPTVSTVAAQQPSAVPVSTLVNAPRR